MRSRQERLGRSVLSAGVSTLVTAAAHTIGGGVIPAPLLLAVVFVASVLLCFALLGRRMSLLGLVPAIAGTQFLLHLVFAFTGDGATLGAGAEHAGHHGAVTPMLMDASAAGHHEGMLFAHVIAGLVTVVSLRLGAGAVRQVLAAVLLRLGMLLAFLLRPMPVRTRGAGIAAVPAAVALRPLLLADVIARRGPPAFVLFA